MITLKERLTFSEYDLPNNYILGSFAACKKKYIYIYILNELKKESMGDKKLVEKRRMKLSQPL